MNIFSRALPFLVGLLVAWGVCDPFAPPDSKAAGGYIACTSTEQYQCSMTCAQETCACGFSPYPSGPECIFTGNGSQCSGPIGCNGMPTLSYCSISPCEL